MGDQTTKIFLLGGLGNWKGGKKRRKVIKSSIKKYRIKTSSIGKNITAVNGRKKVWTMYLISKWC